MPVSFFDIFKSILTHSDYKHLIDTIVKLNPVFLFSTSSVRHSSILCSSFRKRHPWVRSVLQLPNHQVLGGRRLLQVPQLVRRPSMVSSGKNHRRWLSIINTIIPTFFNPIVIRRHHISRPHDHVCSSVSFDVAAEHNHRYTQRLRISSTVLFFPHHYRHIFAD